MVCRFVQKLVFTASILLLSFFSATPALALQGGGDNEGPGVGGIEIDANGIISRRVMVDNAGVLNRQRWAAAKASLNQDLQKSSKLRCVSLTRLEQEVKKYVEAGQSIPDEMKYLAGMTKVSHVFFYPETGDIVIAGPAEGYFMSAANSVVGIETGRSTLQLQDLVVALRAFGPQAQDTRVISCSIDPTQEGLMRMKEALTFAQRNFGPNDAAKVIQLFRQALGMQEISIKGVSNKTNFARVMVEADYRMKLIGIGLEQPAVPMTTFAAKVTPSSVSKNALIRWFFQPDYDCIMINEDGNSIQFVGGGVKLVGEDEMVNRDGQRKVAGVMNKASKAYCESFTKVYEKLAEVDPIWAELRNVMDLSMVAAFVQKYELYQLANWDLGVFGDESKFRTEVINPPTHVAPVANAIFRGNSLMTPIAGGVAMQPRMALNSDRLKSDGTGEIDSSKAENEDRLSQLNPGQWWWD